MRRTVLISTILVIGQFLVAMYLYNIMPERMAIHWNMHGEADGYGSRIIGLFLVPSIELVLLPVFLILPKIDPIGDLDKNKLAAFTKKYKNVAYSKIAAGFAGIDIKYFEKKKFKYGGFCSWLVALCLIDQGYPPKAEQSNALEIIPSDLWHENKLNKKLLYSYEDK